MKKIIPLVVFIILALNVFAGRNNHSLHEKRVNPLKITPSAATICSGNSVLLTASGIDSAQLVGYVWSNGATTDSTTVSPTVTTTYTVTANLTFGGSLTRTVTITIPAVTITPSSASICAGSSATLTASGVATYLWNDGETTSAINVTPASTTTYSVTGTSAQGCTSNATQLITVNQATITITASPSDSSCQGIVTSGSGPDQVVISNGSPITLTVSGGVTYYWNTGSTTDTIKVINPGTYTVNATDANGCTGSAIITIYPGITYNVSMFNSASNNSLCSLGFTPGKSDEVFFSIAVSGAGSGSFRTVWTTTGGAVLTSNQGNPQAQVSFSDITQGGTVIAAVTPVNFFGHPIGCTKIDSTVIKGCPCSTYYPLVSVNSPTVCAGSSTTLTASGFAKTYLWSTGATTQSITVSPATTITYSITGSFVPGSAGNCSQTQTATVTVVTPKTLTITPPAISYCAGNFQATQLTATQGFNSYQWSNGDNNYFTEDVTGQTYSVTAVDSNGCNVTDSVVSTAYPAPTVTITPSSASICSGSSATLTASGATTYLWSDGETTASINVSPTGTTTYSVTGTSAQGCTGTASQSITVNPSPTITPSSASICLGSSATLTASGATTYVWSDGETTASITVDPTATTTYTVTGTNCVNTQTVAVTVDPLPTISVTPTSTTTCAGYPTVLTASGGSAYTWAPSAGLSATTGVNVTASPATATTYTVIGATTAGCTGSANVSIITNSTPTVTITEALPDLCKGSSTTMLAIGANTYKWSNGSTEASIIVSPDSNYTYVVTGTGANGCKDSASIQILVKNCSAINQSDSIGKKRLICGTNAESADSLVRAERANHGPYGNGPVTWSGPTGSVKYCWPFAFYFDDIGTGNGFDPASGYGTAAQNTLCAAGQYIASVFDFSAIGATNYITIHVNSSIISGGAPYYAIAGPNRTYAVDGTTTWPNQGVYAGDVFDHTVNGVDPSLGTTFNGILTVNFSGVVTGSYPTYFTYLYDYTQPINNCQMDLYSVFVHELTHTMGFISDVVEGTPTPVCYSGSAFSLYDWDFLFHAASTISIGNPNPGMTKLVSGTTTPTDYTTPEINPFLTGIDAVGDANLWLYDMGGRNVTSGTNNNQPVYSGCPYNTFLNVPGSYISHLDESFTSWTTRTVQAPGYQPDYVMAPFGLPGRLKREYTLPEVRALLYLKNPKTLKTYTLLSTYKNAAIINNNPPVVTNAAQYTTTDQSYQDLKVVPDAVITNSGTYTYNVANDISNGIAYDPDAGDQLQIMPGTIYNIQGCGSNGNNNDAQLSFSGSPITSITFTPRTNFIGRAQFGFYLYDGKEQGAFRVVTVDVTQDPTFVNIPNVNTPAGLTELVVNGDYEEGIHCATLADNFAVSSIMKCYELEGPYIWGNQFADAHPLEIYGWGWTAGSGENITGSYNDCSGPNTQEFGDFQFSNNYGFWPSKPLPNPKPSGTSYRYHNFVSNINWSTLASPTVGTPPVQECNQYTLVFDINFSNSGLSSGTIVPITVGFASNFSTTPSYNFSTSVPVTVGAGPINSDGWQTVTSTFWYCGNPSKYMNFENSSWQLALLDNISLTQVQSPPPLLVSVSATNLTICAGQSTTLTPTVTNTRCGNDYLWSNGATTSSITVSPTTTTTYTVTVTDIDGCGTATSSPLTITVNPVPAAPTASSNSPLCAGNSLNLTASTVAGATYNWTGPNSFTSSSQNPSIASVTAANAGTYSVNVTVNGCTSPNATTTVTVNPIPAAPTAGSNSPVCSGTTLSLTASTVAGAIYSWTGPNSFTSSSQNPSIASVTAAAAGTYSVNVTVSGCTSASSSITVIVNPTPAAPTAGSNSSVCTGTTLNLTASTIAGATYSWTGPNSFSSSSQNPSIASVTAAAGTYSVSATVSGCTSSVATTTVIVNPTPTAPIAGSNSPVCTGTSLNLTASTVAGASYNWTGPNSFTSSSQNPSIASATTSAAGTYSVNVTVNGCTSINATTTVIVNPTPAAPTAGSNSPVCSGTTLNLTSSTVAGATYSWTGPNSFTSSSQNPSIASVTTAAAGTYSVNVTVNGCTSTNATTTVIVNPTPAAPTAGSNSPVCSGTTLNLTSSTVAGATYSWTGPNSFSSSSQNPSIASVTVAATGTYSVNVTVGGCTSPNAKTVVTVKPTPVAPTAGSNSPVCAGSALNLTSSTVAGATYSWTGPNSFSSLSQNPSIASATAAATGTYSVNVTVGGCTSPNATTVVTVKPTPAAPTAGSNSPVCSGTTLNLTSSIVPGATYSWTGPNSFSSSFQNPSIASVTAAATGTYSVSVTVGGCTSPNATTVVTVKPTPAAPIAGSNSPVCDGSALNLTSSTIPGATYSWTGPNSFISSSKNPSIASVTAAAAGTYSVNVTVGGCTSPNATTTVTVTTVTVVLSSPPSTCSGTSTVLTASGASTYVWSPKATLSSSTGASVIATPTITTTYVVVGTTGTCSSVPETVVVTVYNCCATNCPASSTSASGTTSYPGGLNIFPGTSASSFGAGPLTITGSCNTSSAGVSVSIAGVFTIPTGYTCTLDNCNIAMASNAQIVVQKNATLNINAARLYACTTMWDGIIVNTGGTLNVTNGSFIDDAIAGIDAGSTGGASSTINVLESTLINDYQDIIVDPVASGGPGNFPLLLQGSILTTGSDGAFSPGPTLKAPYAGAITYSGVYLNNADPGVTDVGVEIGDPTKATYVNTFSKMNYGVYAVNSNFVVFNNIFENLDGLGQLCLTCGVCPPHPCPPQIGIAVLATAPSPSTSCTAIVGDKGANQANAMINCYRGVDLTNYDYQAVINNVMWNSINILKPPFTFGKVPFFGDHGIYIKSTAAQEIELNRNRIVNYTNAIHILGTLPNMLMTGNTDIDSNDIYITTSKNASMINGILVENVTNTAGIMTAPKLGVVYNTVDSANFCIDLSGISNIPTTVHDNPQLLVMPSAKTDGTFKAGIVVQNCVSAGPFETQVVNNQNIFSTGNFLSSIANKADVAVMGINTILSPGTEVDCNTVYNVGQGIRFDGNCNNGLTTGNSAFSSNTIGIAGSSCYDGFVLANGGIVGEQGQTGQPIGDIWTPGSSFLRSQTYTLSSPAPVASNSILYVNSGAATFPTLNKTNQIPFNTYSYNESGAINKTTGTPPGSCPVNFFFLMKPPGNSGSTGSNAHRSTHQAISDSMAVLQHQMDMFVLDSIPYLEFIPETQFLDKQWVYNSLNADSTLMDGDIVLQSFYKNTKGTCMGGINSVEELTLQGNYSAAQSRNNLLIPQNGIEQNHKDIKNIKLYAIIQGDSTIDSTQYRILWSIAHQCVYSGGRAVYEARYMLNYLYNTALVFEDTCSGQTTDKPEEINGIKNIINANVYPNPANSQLNVQVDLQPNETATICLYNSMGEKVRCETLSNRLTTISAVDLVSGIYYYRITSSGNGLIKADKVIIIH